MKNWRLQNNATLQERKALQKLCREQTKLRLLDDIKKDIIVCQLEDWDYKEYLRELICLIQNFLRNKKKNESR